MEVEVEVMMMMVAFTNMNLLQGYQPRNGLRLSVSSDRRMIDINSILYYNKQLVDLLNRYCIVQYFSSISQYLLYCKFTVLGNIHRIVNRFWGEGKTM